MTIITPTSIIGINSITAQSGSLNFYTTAGATLSISANINSTGVSTITTLSATNIIGVSTAGITTVYIGSVNDGPISGARNRIINGDMRMDQRNAGTSVTVADATATFGVDRFRFTESTSASSCTVQQVSDAPTGFTNSLKITVGTGGSASAGQVVQLCHPIEGYNWADLLYGSSSAKSFTIQFWVKSSLTGTYCFSIFNSAGNRSYVAEYTIIAANTWEYKTITVAGDTTGTWLTTNGAGAFINWDFGGGSNFNVTANTWGTTSYASRTTNQVNWISNSGATFYLTGVQLEPGTVATPFERRSYGQELALCRRYYKKGLAAQGNSNAAFFWSYYGGSNGVKTFDIDFASFRASPNLSLLNNSNFQYYSYAGAWTNTTLVITTVGTWSNNEIYLYFASDGDGRGKLARCTNATDIHWVADAEL